jgi:hypothetical protein
MQEDRRAEQTELADGEPDDQGEKNLWHGRDDSKPSLPSGR